MADPRSNLSRFLFFAAFTTLYYLSARFGLIFGVEGLGVSPVWPAAGLALAAVMLLGLREWPIILGLIFVANLLPGQLGDNPFRNWHHSLGDAAITTFEAALAGWLLRGIAGSDDILGRVRGVFHFTGVVLLACLVGGLIAVTWGGLIGRSQTDNFTLLWFVFWVGDCAGMLVVTPLVLSWWHRQNARTENAKKVEGMLAMLAGTVMTILVFRSPPNDVYLDSAPFLIFPALLWGTYRLGRRQAASMIAVSATIAVWGTFNGYGPFSDGSMTAALILLQLYVCTLSVGFMALAAAYAENRQAQRSIAEQKKEIQVTLDSIGDGVIRTDRQTHIRYMNPVASGLTGWKRDEALGRPLDDVVKIFDEDTREPVSNPVNRLLSGDQGETEQRSVLMVDRHGREFYVEDTTALLSGEEQQATGAVLVLRDISKQRRMAIEMAYHARHDTLTGLVNRRVFEQRVRRAMNGARLYDTHHVVCYLDLDQFKIVNDTAGHAAGDELLRQLRDTLMERLRDRDTLARIGGDEFGLLLENCPLEKAVDIAQSIVDCVSSYRFSWQGAVFQVGVSIGLTTLTADTPSMDRLLAQADIACFTAKELGRNQVHVYSSEDSESAQRHVEIQCVSDLRGALENNRFRLFCQRIMPVNGAPKHPIHYEVLLRLIGANDEIIGPEHFIPAAERYGLAPEIDRWVIRSALQQHKELFGTGKSARLAINLSGKSLTGDALLAFVLSELDSSAIPPQSVCFEVTETATIQNFKHAQKFIDGVRGNGCQLALDDFGSGLSSFSYLKNLSFDYLKIDGSFVRHIADDEMALGMVRAINDVGRIMATKTVGEFTESAAILDRLRSLGVDYAQGYYIGKPLPLLEALG